MAFSMARAREAKGSRAPWLEEVELDMGKQAGKMQTDAGVRPPPPPSCASSPSSCRRSSPLVRRSFGASPRSRAQLRFSRKDDDQKRKYLASSASSSSLKTPANSAAAGPPLPLLFPGTYS